MKTKTRALLLLVALAGCATTSAKDDLEARLVVLESQVAAVERRADAGVTLLDRVTALENALAAPPPGPDADVAARLAALEAQLADLGARVAALEARDPTAPPSRREPTTIPGRPGDVAPPADGAQVEVLSAGSGALVLVRAAAGLSRLSLRGVDAPERADVYAQSATLRARHAEAFGEAATRDDAAFEASRRKLEELLRGTAPTVEGSRRADGGAEAYLRQGDVDINAAMIREGFALARPGHPRAAEYEALEAAARAARRGLFAPPQ